MTPACAWGEIELKVMLQVHGPIGSITTGSDDCIVNVSFDGEFLGCLCWHNQERVGKLHTDDNVPISLVYYGQGGRECIGSDENNGHQNEQSNDQRDLFHFTLLHKFI